MTVATAKEMAFNFRVLRCVLKDGLLLTSFDPYDGEAYDVMGPLGRVKIDRTDLAKKRPAWLYRQLRKVAFKEVVRSAFANASEPGKVIEIGTDWNLALHNSHSMPLMHVTAKRNMEQLKMARGGPGKSGSVGRCWGRIASGINSLWNRYGIRISLHEQEDHDGNGTRGE